ncbi:transcription termination factor Rho [Lachnospiraceae bacterium AM48-27BH]|nr:transcription termination factor Rho [Lachnospiraceae bacterium AM48-27BH]
MREKLQTLPLTQLKEIAKSQGMKGVSGMKKSDLIDLLCQKAEESQGETGVTETPARTESQSRTEGQNRTENQSRTENQPRSEGQMRPYNQYRQNNYQSRNDGQYRQNRTYGQYNRQDRNDSRTDNRSDRNDSRIDNRIDNRTDYRQDRAASTMEQNLSAQSSAQQSIQNPSNSYSERTERTYQTNPAPIEPLPQGPADLDSGIEANGILEVMPDGFGFIRCENFLPGENDVYVAPSQIRRFNLKTGDVIVGSRRIKTAQEKFAALLYIKTVNGYPLSSLEHRPNFEDLTPIFPNQRLHMETPGRANSIAMRVLDLLAPIGKGQRGMIVSPPKAGKTTLLKQVAQAITTNHPDMHLIILLIDERPEEVTDIKESVVGDQVEVIYSTFDELPERHKRVSEMVVERARRLVEHGRDVIILLDSITRLARAYNIVVPPSGRTLSGGMDPAALHMPKRFFGAARNMREGGSLTILATALVNTGSRMDDVVYEEFKGTGNMELVLDRKLSEKRIFPAIDILKSGTRNDQLLLTPEEQECVDSIRKATNSLKPEDSVEQVLNLFARTRTNKEFIEIAKKTRFS